MAMFLDAIYGSGVMDCLFDAEQRARSTFAATRPWLEMLRLRAFTLPSNLADALLRVRINAAYFAANYAVTVVLAVLLHLAWRKPSYLGLFLFMAASWICVYLFRDEEDSGNCRIPVVALSISILIVIGLLFTGALVDFVVASAIGAAAIVAHAAMRRVDEVVEGAEEGDGYVQIDVNGVF